MKEMLVKYLSELLEGTLSSEEINTLLEAPKIAEHGDYSIPMFSLSKSLKKSPVIIAEDYAKKAMNIKPEFIAQAKNMGPYLNFYLDRRILAIKAIETSLAKDNGKSAEDKGRIVVEYAQPNTNKPLHLGHLRNMILGKSLILLLQRRGYDVLPVILFNDRGIAICKSMLMYKLFGNNETPEFAGIKPDQFVGKYYVMFEEKKGENPDLEAQAREMLRKWEEGDNETVALWSRMNEWAESGIKKTFSIFKMPYEKEYYESDVYKRGVEVVNNALEEGMFEKAEDGAVIYRIDEDNFYTLLREDGTALYITQDIALAEQKRKDYGDAKYVFVVAADQSYHFKILFEILEKLKISRKEDNYHFPYGLVTLPEGKMSSRKGNVIGADALIDDITEMAARVAKEKNRSIDEEESKRRGRTIGLGALSYMMLKQNPLSDIVFDKEKSLSFEGETGPYIMYTYARIKSVLRKAQNNSNANTDLGEEEYEVSRKLIDYSDIVAEAAEKYKPSLLANYILELSQAFNEYYHKVKIIGSEKEQARLKLCEAVSTVLKDGLSLLGMEVLEEM